MHNLYRYLARPEPTDAKATVQQQWQSGIQPEIDFWIIKPTVRRESLAGDDHSQTAERKATVAAVAMCTGLWTLGAGALLAAAEG